MLADLLLVGVGVGVAEVEAHEARDLDVLAELGDVRLDELVNRHVGIADVRLLHQQLRIESRQSGGARVKVRRGWRRR